MQKGSFQSFLSGALVRRWQAHFKQTTCCQQPFQGRNMFGLRRTITASLLWCCDQLFRRTGDIHWLERLYPKAAAYLRWWLEHRRDADGWLVYACSWESGQDVSSRFGPQQTGGTIIQHVRPVDLQASIALSAEILARWATLLAGSMQN